MAHRLLLRIRRLQPREPIERSLRGRRTRSRLATPGLPGSMSALAGRSRISPPPSVRPNITLRRLRGAGPGRPRPRGGGTRWPRWPRLPPRRSSGRGHAAARPQRLPGRRLFVLGLAGPALSISPIGSERAARVYARVCAPVRLPRPTRCAGRSFWLPAATEWLSAPPDSRRRLFWST